MQSQTALGFIGLGQMGRPMAERLLAADIDLHVYDPSAGAMEPFIAGGATAHRSPRDVADSARIVFACLPSGSVSEAVALGPDGVVNGAGIRIYVEMSTIGKTCIESIARGLSTRGVDTVDAPITGGPQAARDGVLTMMASGTPAALEQVTPWLLRIGRHVHKLGDAAGQAQIMKLINNVLMATNFIAACQGLVMGAKAGLDAAAMMDVLREGTGHSASADILARSRTTDFGARLSIVDKDVHLALAEAAALGVPTQVMQAAAVVWRTAAENGLADLDFPAVLELMEREGGAKVRSLR